MENILSNSIHLFLPVVKRQISTHLGYDPYIYPITTQIILYGLLFIHLWIWNIIRATRQCNEENNHFRIYGFHSGWKIGIVTTLFTFLSLYILKHASTVLPVISFEFLYNIPWIEEGLVLAFFAFVYQYIPSRILFGYCA